MEPNEVRIAFSKDLRDISQMRTPSVEDYDPSGTDW